MNKENTKLLINKFPELYRDYYKPMTETCMCWGFECGNGWFKHILLLSEMLSSYLKQHPELIEEFRVVQVKEKFGTLRYYVHGGDDNIERLIDLFEITSHLYCENCGTTETVKSTDGWVQYLCETCIKAKKETNCGGHSKEKSNRKKKKS